MTESAINTINNLAQSVIDVFYDDDCDMDKTAYAEDIMRQIKNICYSLSTKEDQKDCMLDGNKLHIQIIYQ